MDSLISLFLVALAFFGVFLNDQLRRRRGVTWVKPAYVVCIMLFIGFAILIKDMATNGLNVRSYEDLFFSIPLILMGTLYALAWLKSSETDDSGSGN